MFSKFIEMVKEAIQKMFGFKTVSDAITDVELFDIGSAMKDAVDLWKAVYKDDSPWLDENEGIYSLQLGKEICQTLQTQVLSEMECKIDGEGEKAKFLQEQWDKHFIKKLPQNLEVAMALGSMIMKPYLSGNEIYIDFCRQGTFVPISYNDDGDIVDIAFPDQVTVGDTVFTRIERHTFSQQKNTIVIENKVYKAQKKGDEEMPDKLGVEVPLDSIERWSSIQPITTIDNVERPLYGYYKVPLANNIDLDSPLGISIFSPAIEMIKRADEQFSRLDWEYEGGQMAVDVDMTALKSELTYFGGQSQINKRQDRLRERLYRSLDLNNDETYKAFTPALRDRNYLDGLDRYLTRIEDLVGISRGSLSSVDAEARTATEIKILKQRTYNTIKAHQEALDKAFDELMYALEVFTDLYKLATKGKATLNVEWKDSILTDTQEEMNQRIQMIHEGIEAKWETRMWWKDEDEETAKEAIAEIEEGEEQELEDDIFSQDKLLADNPFNEKE